MALRRAEDVGFTDPRQLSGAVADDAEASGAAPASQGAQDRAAETAKPGAAPNGHGGGDSAGRGSRPATGRRQPAGRATPSPGRRAAEPRGRTTELPLADQPAAVTQAFSPADIRERLEDASLELGESHPKLRHQKTIIGALLWRYVDHENAEAMAELGRLLEQWSDDPLSEAPADKKVGVYVPESLKRRLSRAASQMRRTQGTELGSAKAIINALIWRYVDPSDLDDLVDLLAEYQAELRPRRLPVAA